MSGMDRDQSMSEAGNEVLEWNEAPYRLLALCNFQDSSKADVADCGDSLQCPKCLRTDIQNFFSKLLFFSERIFSGF